MLDAVLRVFGNEFDVGTFLQKNSVSVQVQPFLKGEPDILGNPNSDSGFDAIISERENPTENMAEVQAFLTKNEPLFTELKSLKVSCIIDIGCGVDAANEFSPSVHLSTELLGLCHMLNVSIEFSAYPN